MLIPDAVAPAFITEQLLTRGFSPPNLLQEKIAIQDLAHLMVDNPVGVLPRLVDLAMEACGAISGGISILERESGVFRWHHLRGTLEAFTGATTPRDYSPCGITLDHCKPTLVAHPESVYTWVADAGISLAEVLLVPLRTGHADPLGTLWIASDESGHFTSSHADTLRDLAGFTGMALQMIESEKRLSTALAEQEMLTQEMAHRVKNLFSITGGMIRLSARGNETKEEFVENISGRLHALAAANSLVRKSFNDFDFAAPVSNLRDVIHAVLAPYERVPHELNGETVLLGDRTTSAVAMLFHELATNAAKYGALSTDGGSVAVTWTRADGELQINWVESGGPALRGKPDTDGFGSKLVNSTIASLRGAIDYNWLPTGVAVSIRLPLAALTE